MAIDTDELRALPPAEKLRLVELLWDDLGDGTAPRLGSSRGSEATR